MLNISVVTLFPDIFTPHLNHLPLKRAVEKNLLKVDLINLRDFAIDKRGTVDSPAYGGGPGMILRPEPIFNAIKSVLNDTSSSTQLIFLTPRGHTYTQLMAEAFSVVEHLIIVCGRYEGMDQRVIDYFSHPTDPLPNLNAREISIGQYILSGGEVPAMAVMESVTRLIPGAIDNTEALEHESFNPNHRDTVEHPQYSRPEEWEAMKVPDILVSGHHDKIKKWKSSN